MDQRLHPVRLPGQIQLFKFLLLTAFGLFLSGCVGKPMTRPPGLVCANVMRLYDQSVTGADQAKSPLEALIERKAAQTPPGQPVTISILAMSGGGKFGAFGAGFLRGWSEAPLPPVRRENIDIVTGISTGSLLASYAAVGNSFPEKRAKADEDARKAYDVSDKELVKKLGLLSAITSNGLVDPSAGLVQRIDTMVGDYMPDMARLPDDKYVLVGAANLTNGHFYVADLREVAKQGPIAQDCYREWLLASSAVPAQFPPRFIDGHGWVDGGVRFGAFLGNSLSRAVGRTRAQGDPLANRVIKVDLIALFNNSLSPNSPAKNPAQALACDRSSLVTAVTACPEQKNSLLGIATRSAGSIMVNQIYRDSLYRLQRELEVAGILRTSRFIYADPAKIAAADADGSCHATTDDEFDRAFMNCLDRLGYAAGKDPRQWQLFDDVPRSRAPEPIHRGGGDGQAGGGSQ